MSGKRMKFLLVPFLAIGVMVVGGIAMGGDAVAKLRADLHAFGDEAQAGRVALTEALAALEALTAGDRDVLDAVDDFEAGALADLRARGDALTSRIEQIDRAAQDVFAHWTEELALFKRDDLRAKSLELLKQTQAEYDKLKGAFEAVATRLGDARATLGDAALLLRHHRSAAAIRGVSGELASLTAEVARLEADIDLALRHAAKLTAQLGERHAE